MVPGRGAAAACFRPPHPRGPRDVSAVTWWEVTIKRSIGKLDVPSVETLVHQARYELRARYLPIRTTHLVELAALPWHHRDPFDRLLIAQARAEGLTLVSSDEEIRKYDVPLLRVWTVKAASSRRAASFAKDTDTATWTSHRALVGGRAVSQVPGRLPCRHGDAGQLGSGPPLGCARGPIARATFASAASRRGVAARREVFGCTSARVSQMLAAVRRSADGLAECFVSEPAPSDPYNRRLSTVSRIARGSSPG